MTSASNSSTLNLLLDAALSYAARGWYVMPLYDVTTGVCSCGNVHCTTPGKHPCISDWPNTASLDPGIIAGWWQQWPTANVGILTGERSHLAVLDVDPRHGGDLALEDLEQTYHPLPDTPMVISGGRGPHHYFALDGPLAKFDPGPGLNLQADGAMVVAPPSLHASGNTYEWEATSGPDDLPLAPLPDWLRALGNVQASAPVTGVVLPDTLPIVDIQTLKVSHRIKYLIQMGQDPDDPQRYASRSEALFAVIHALLAAGHDDATIASILMDKQYRISDKVLSQKNARNPRYWDQTKGWVAREIARAKAKHHPPPPFMAQGTVPLSSPNGHSAPSLGGTPGPQPATASTPPSSQSTSPPGQQATRQRPDIIIRPEIDTLVDEAQDAVLNAPDAPMLYQRARGLYVIARGVTPPQWLHRPQDLPIALEASPARLREFVGRAAQWWKLDKRAKQYEPALPPTWVVDTLEGRKTWPFPPLEGIVCSPTLRPDGSLLAVAGYDVSTGLYLDLNGTIFPAIPSQPTFADARSALGRLQEVFYDFLFATRTSTPSTTNPYFSAAIAAVLTLVGRPAIQGNVPLFGVTATAAGSGKGKLVDAIVLIGTGRTAPKMGQTLDDNEELKRLLALALEGVSTCCIDNATHPLGNQYLSMALTAQAITGRILGQTVTAEAPWTAVLFATGNNLAYRDDMSRRVVPIALDPRMEKPEERSGFLHADLEAWVRQQRPGLVMAALTILRAYFEDGCPAQRITPYGSFEAWSDLVRNAVVWLGEADPCEGRQDLTAHADESYEQLAALLTAWQACFPPRADGTLQKRTLNQVKQEIGVYATRNAATPNTWDDLRDALIPFDQKFDGKVLDTNRLGNALRKVEGRVIDRTRFKRHGEYRHNACWQVDPV